VKKEERRQKTWYYIDELSILLITFASVFLSDAVNHITEFGFNGKASLTFEWVEILVAAMLSVVVYASVHSKFKYNDNAKPPYIKRASIAILQGIAWRTVVSWKG
jgi:hypothetical protein